METPQRKLRKECRNWLLLPNGLVEIHTGRFGRIILSESQSIVWQLMSTEMDLQDLEKAYQSTALDKPLRDILDGFAEAGIIRILDEESEFDLLFA